MLVRANNRFSDLSHAILPLQPRATCPAPNGVDICSSGCSFFVTQFLTLLGERHRLAGYRCPFWKRRGAEKQRIAEKDCNLFYLCVFSFPPSSAFPKAVPIPFRNLALCS